MDRNLAALAQQGASADDALPARHLIATFTPLLLWLGNFVLIHSAIAVVCTRGLPVYEIGGIGVVTALIAAVTGATAICVVALAARLLQRISSTATVRGRPHDAGFLLDMTVTIAIVALIGIAWNALPVMLTPLCG